MWNETQIKNHQEAARLLLKIKDSSFNYIRNNDSVNEYGVQQFIIGKFKEFGLKSDRDPPIVAFGKNTADAHYYPKRESMVIKKGDLIMIDIWARLNVKSAPFADITWMGYCGKKVPEKISKLWEVVVRVRDESIECVRDNLAKGKLPKGRDIYLITNDIMREEGFGRDKHYTGHSLGLTSAHGNRAHLKNSNGRELVKNLGYTLEPGIYLEGNIGLRSEIDFFISEDKKMILTTDVQKEIILI